MTTDDAEMAAILILGALGHEEREMAAFQAQSGIGPDDIAAGARSGSPEFFAGLLDFVMADEKRLLKLSEAAGLPPEEVSEARRAFPGGREWLSA